MSAYKRDFEKTKCMSSLIKDEKLIEKYNEIRKKVNNIINKEFDSKPVYKKKYLKSKIKSYNGKIITNFHNNKIQKRRLLMSKFLTDGIEISSDDPDRKNFDEENSNKEN